jgi:hypothetical protein
MEKIIYPTASVCTNFLTNRASKEQIFKKYRSHLKILGARNMTQNKFCIEAPQILDTTVQNLNAMATWPPTFVRP